MNQLIFSKYLKRVGLPALFFCAVLSQLTSCTKDNFNNTGFSASDNPLNVVTVDTFSFSATTVKEDSVDVVGYLYQLLGAMNEQNFGETKASLATQLLLSEEDPFFIDISDIAIDSVNMLLNIQKTYGTDAGQDFKVFMLSEALDTSNNFKSNSILNYDQFEVADAKNVKINTDDSVNLGGDNYAPGLKIPLYNTFGEYLLNSNRFAIISNEDFLNYFHGLFIVPQSSFAQGEGGVVRLNLTSSQSRIRINYHSISTGEEFYYDFVFGSGAVKFSTFRHDVTNSTLEQALGDPKKSDEYLYIKSAAGCYVKLDLTFLEKFAAENNAVINKAELVVPVENDIDLPYEPHQRLFITSVSDEGKEVILLDQFESETHYGGLYDATEGQYKLRITRAVQQKIDQLKNNENPNTQFHLIPGDLIPGGAAVNANQTLIAGKNNPNLSRKFKLIISYTPLNK